MKLHINAYWWDDSSTGIYLDEIETRNPYAGMIYEDVVVIKMNTTEDLTPRQVSGDHYNFWSIHSRELNREKKI